MQLPKTQSIAILLRLHTDLALSPGGWVETKISFLDNLSFRSRSFTIPKQQSYQKSENNRALLRTSLPCIQGVAFSSDCCVISPIFHLLLTHHLNSTTTLFFANVWSVQFLEGLCLLREIQQNLVTRVG